MARTPQIFNAYVMLLSTMMAVCVGVAHPEEIARDAVTEVRNKGVLRVCVVTDYAGISFRDPRTGRLFGLDIEMSKRLAERLGATARYVETNFIDFIADLQSRRCHIAMMGIWVSEGRKARIDFSEPYLASGAYVAVAKANKQLQKWADIDRSTTVVSVIDSPDLLQRARKLLPNATLDPLPFATAALRGSTADEVRSGRADALIVDYSMAASIKRNDSWARIIAPPKTIIFVNFAYAVPQGETRLLETVNTFVRDIKSDGSLRSSADMFGLAELLVPP